MHSSCDIPNNGETFFKAPPLLKKMPKIAVKSHGKQQRKLTPFEKKELAQYIIQNRVGSYFWQASPSFCARAILCFSSDATKEEIIQQRDLFAQTYLQKEIVIIVPRNHPFSSQRHLQSSPICHRDTYDPHALLQGTAEIYNWDPDNPFSDICLLSTLKNIPTHFIDHEGLKNLLSYEEALAHIFDDLFCYCPFTQKTIPISQLLPILKLWREVIFKNREIDACIGISPWKKQYIKYFLSQAPGAPQFPISLKRTLYKKEHHHNFTLAIWASRLQRKHYQSFLRNKGGKIYLIEDGFLRSRGLGSAFTPPASITIDTKGICHDPSTPSDLEYLLEHTQFSASLLMRSRKIIERLKRENISKYGGNPHRDKSSQDPHASHRKNKEIILVPGQVFKDLSVERGSAHIKDNLTLLKYVRDDNPHAWIIYRPHPDVEAGYRMGKIDDQETLKYANEINRDQPITDLFNQIDRLHTMTSLSGFEALIRDIPVTCWGVPFYAGWGLTEDKGDVPRRRTRRLSLTQLVAATLIIYPRYLDPVSKLPCPVEIVIDRLGEADIWHKNIWMYLRHTQQYCHHILGKLKRLRN